MDVLVYDVELCQEIKGKEDWKKVNDEWFGSAVVYSYKKDDYSFFLHQSGLKQLKTLLNRSKVISFNGITFDSCVVLGRTRSILKTRNRYGLTIQHGSLFWTEYDLFINCMKGYYNIKEDYEARKKISPGGFRLNDICKRTLGIGKNGKGSEAPRLYQQKRYDDLLSYNLQDVRITKNLLDHVLKFGWIRNRDGKKVKMERPLSWFESLSKTKLESSNNSSESFSGEVLPPNK